MLPNFLIIGAEKAGTTWLHARMSAHPEVFMPRTKEPHFFNACNSNLERIDRYENLGLGWYERLFEGHRREKAVGEATPMYLCDPEAPERIRETLGSGVRLIACLRNPVDRAYSHYWMARRKQHTELSFAEVVRRKEPRFIQRGLYHRQFQRYQKYFSPDQLLVLIHEELFDNVARHLDQLCDFVGVDSEFFEKATEVEEVKHGASEPRSVFANELIGRVAKWMRRRAGVDRVLDVLKASGIAARIKALNRRRRAYPPLGAALREQLENYYADDVRALEENVLERPIDAWNITTPYVEAGDDAEDAQEQKPQ
jgi:hypothetical protein